MRALRPGPLYIAALLGCQPVIELEPPTADPGYSSALLITRIPGLPLRIDALRAIDSHTPALPAGSAPDGTELAVVYYRASAEALFFDLLDEPDRALLPTRAIPAFDAGFQRRLDGDVWRPISLAELSDVRLPAPGEIACAERDGCYLDASGAAELDCKVPCKTRAAPSSPTLPAPPELGACLAGWTRRSDPAIEGLVLAHCDPPATQPCGPDEAQWVSSSSCAVVGHTCPAEWPTDLPSGRPLLYVRAGAAAGGSGGPNDPYATIAEAALAGDGLGPVLVLARGVHSVVAPLRLGDQTSVIGACAAGTTIAGPPNVTTFSGDGIGLEIRDVELRPGRGGHAINTKPGASLLLADAAIVGPMALGIWGDAGSDVALERVLVRTATTVALQFYGNARLRQVVIEDAGLIGLRVEGARAELDRVVVRRVAPGSPLIAGCVVAAYGATLLLERSLLERCTSYGVQIYRSFGEVRDTTIRDVVLGPPRSPAEIPFAAGVEADGSGVGITRVQVEDARSYGALFVHSTVGASDLIIERTIPDASDPSFGFGIRGLGATLTLARAWIRASGSSGITLAFTSEDVGRFTSALSDLVVDDTRMNSPDSGEGLAFQALNDGTVDRVLVIDAARRSLGLFVDAKVRVSDLTTLRGGSAVRLDDDCRLTLHRARLQRPSTGFCATKTSSASLDNVVVEGADGDAPSDICGLAPSAGVGFVLTDMSQLAARQVRITGSDDAALSFARTEVLFLEDGLIDHNRVGLTAPANYLRGSLIRTRFEANPILFVPLP